jgi:MFS-type transporter involved in bile tolerance (Atg22 family)
MDAAYDPAAWHDFGVALVSASAALLGLVFVVVSLHLGAVVDNPVLRRRAEIMLGLLATTLAASAALLIPGQSREALGIELMLIADLHKPVDVGDLPRDPFPARRLARPPRSVLAR